MPRTTLHETRMLGYTNLLLDMASALLLGVLNGHTTIRHKAGVTEEAVALFEKAGIHIDEDIHTFTRQEEAEALADNFIAQGKRLFWFYPPATGRFHESSHLVSPSLYRYLNAKSNLHQLVPAANLPARSILSHEEFQNFMPEKEVFFKSAGDAATGWGYAVHPCTDVESLQSAKLWFKKHQNNVPAVIVEEAVPLVACWCAGIVVGNVDTQYIGAAEQLFNSPARQYGSIIDPENPFPADGAELAVTVGEKARELGYRGFAGIDIGLSTDGRLLVFDPNFRVASSTNQILYHKAATERSGYRVSYSFQVKAKGTFKDLSKTLEIPIKEGWFVPTRIFNGEMHPYAEGRHTVTGIILGHSRTKAEQTALEFQSKLE